MPVPRDVSGEIDRVAADIGRTRPLSTHQRTHLSAAISDLNLSASSKNVEEESVIRGVGLPAVPVVEELLRSPNVVTRRKAASAMSTLSVALVSTSDWDKGASAMVLLSRRSLLDRDVEVRLRVLSVLGGIGFVERKKLPAELAAALEEALQDPEERVRAQAQDFKEILGLAPRDPKSPISN
jgi:HEAT repeat protein